MKKIAIALSALTSVSALAGSAADALMRATSPAPAKGSAKASAPTTTADSAGVVDGELRMTNPVARQLYAEWSTGRGRGTSGFEAGNWVRSFLDEKYEATAHLWGAISPKLPDRMDHSAKAAYLYSLYKLDLPQTFFDQWIASLGSRGFAESRGAAALEEAIAANFDSWYLNNAIQISPDQAAIIRRVGDGKSAVLTSLLAATYERKGEAGRKLLEKLPTNSAFRPLLAQTAAVSLARKHDLSGAGSLLKTYYEPWLATAGDARSVSGHYMQIARLLYEAGSFDGAASYYEKIPTGSPDYLTAREELSWCLLRMGDNEKLRGNLKSLTSKALSDRFQPEAYLVRAIANLKSCYYGEVEKDFADFLASNKTWAAKIQANVKSGEPEAPRVPDYFSQRAVKAEAARRAELALLKGLSERSIAAVLPAVGPQKHWTDAIRMANQDLESAKKTKAGEFRRQWKNDFVTLNEAIRKMQFVKVELMSQVAMLNAGMKATGSARDVAAASGQTVDHQAAKEKMRSEGDMVFPFDGVVWPDELFKLRSQADSQCLGGTNHG